jgi:hypothetical protein
MNRGPLQRWRERGGRVIDLTLPFADIMEIALALVALSPGELDTLGWTFGDRKRILNQFLSSGKQAQEIDRASLDHTDLTLRLPVRDIRRLQKFAWRELPKRATRANVIERLGRNLDAALAPRS